MKKNGFNLLELIVVMLIITILASLGLANYSRSKEIALSKEAVANLKLLQAAEKSYRYEAGTYYPSAVGSNTSDISAINSNLKLSLVSGNGRNWNYTVFSTGCVAAQRNAGSTKWWLNNTTEEPIQNDTAGPNDCQ